MCTSTTGSSPDGRHVSLRVTVEAFHANAVERQGTSLYPATETRQEDGERWRIPCSDRTPKGTVHRCPHESPVNSRSPALRLLSRARTCEAESECTLKDRPCMFVCVCFL
ncbi:hypothetical protein MRX96_040805 [Rhipicephalus microplus]